MNGAALRSAAAKLRQRYAAHFAIPIDGVRIRYCRDERGEEDAAVEADGLPEWTVGADAAQR
jgi:hypothetical protein